MQALLTPMALMITLGVVHHPAPAHHPHARPHGVHRAGAKPAAAQVPVAQDDVEEIESVEAVPTPAASDTASPARLREHVLGAVPDATAPLSSAAGLAAALGHFHAAFVHLPIAWVTLWAMVEMLGVVSAHVALAPAALFLGFITLLSYAPAILSGLCRYDELSSATKGYETAEAILHRNLIYVSAALCAACLFVRLVHWRWPNVVCRLICLLGVGAAFAVTAFSAHLGGRMVYGAEFFPF